MRIPKLFAGTLGLMLMSATAAAAFPAVSTTSLNVRSGPGTGYPVVDTLRPGETVEVTGSSGSWYRLEGGGWASANYLSAGGSAGYVEDYYEYGTPAFYYGSVPYFWDDAGYYWYWRSGNRHRVNRDWWHRHRSNVRWHHRWHRRDWDNDRRRGERPRVRNERPRVEQRSGERPRVQQRSNQRRTIQRGGERRTIRRSGERSQRIQRSGGQRSYSGSDFRRRP